MDNSPLFVARDSELEILDSALQQMLKGKGQLRLVRGKAGAGKSSLATEFAHLAQTKHPDLVQAAGLCDPQTGAQDPYLPFREILLRMMAAAEPIQHAAGADQPVTERMKRVALFSMEAVLEVGPDLVGMVLPGGKFLAQVGRLAVKRTGWLEKFQDRFSRQEVQADLKIASGLTRDQVFEQYINVLKKISTTSPLILVVDDLHWADEASLELLFRLCRRIEDSRILLIGTFRPEDLPPTAAGERHPLERLLNELQRYYGEIVLDLDTATSSRGRQFIDALVDAEPNDLDETFRQSLFLHTSGHPLFTVELLRDLRENGGLLKSPGGIWVSSSGLDWSRMPARVEGVIAERIGRLPAPVREEMAAASIEGEQFTAEVLAIILDRDLRQLVRRLSGELQREHQLIESDSLVHVGTQRLSTYRFSHSLTRKYLQDRIDPIEKAYLHEEIAEALERLYGQYTPAYAIQLAYHYEQAQITDKAATYLLEAGKQSAARFAHQTALEYLVRAEGFLTGSRMAERYELYETRVKIFDMLGDRARQKEALDALLRLAEKTGDLQKLSAAQLMAGQFALDTGDLDGAVEIGKNVLQQAVTLPSDNPLVDHLRVNTNTLIGQGLRLRGSIREARDHLQQAADFAQMAEYPQGQVLALNQLSMTYWSEGEYSAAVPHLEKALTIARHLEDPRREGSVLSNLGVIAREQQRLQEAVAYYRQALDIARRIGDRLGESTALTNLGDIYFHIGDYTLARGYLTDAQIMAAEIGDRSGAGIALVNLAECARMLGDLRQAGKFAQQAYALFQETGFRMGEGIILGNLAAMSHADGRLDLQRKFAEQSLAVALEVSDRFGEGIALNLLAQAMFAAHEIEEAELVFARAADVWSALQDAAGYFQAELGLARCALEKANPTASQKYRALARQIAAADTSLDRLPLDAYVELHNALARLEAAHLTQEGTPSAEEIARLAKQVLNKRASRISGSTDRAAYLQQVALHRQVLNLPG